MYFPEALENTPLTLLSNVKFLVEDFFKFCGLYSKTNVKIKLAIKNSIQAITYSHG